MKPLIERQAIEPLVEEQPVLPRPMMNIKVDFDGYDLTVTHSRSREPAPHIESLFEAILVKDVNPFNTKDVEAYKRLTSNPLFCLRHSDYYLIIPDSADNRRICKTMTSAKNIRWDVLD